MFGLGFWEVLLILAVALLVFGPARLPGLARSLGRGLREFRRASSDLQQAILSADTPDPAPPPRAGPADQAAQTPLPESPGTDSAAPAAPQGAGQPPGSDG
ncbi:MAG: twin-arginine translocase TatA/TatE family subunit [Deltaproteobacteria bacterium]|nr:twin-arginine translocase TatA/TatE family subunit [Deltaproteobacteria bacterium]